MKIIPNSGLHVKKVVHEQPMFNELEMNIIELMMEGRAHKEIGDVLYRSKRTIDGCVRELKKKLGAKTEVEMVVKSIYIGLFRLE